VNDVVPIGKVIAKIKTGAADTAFSRPAVTSPVKEPETSYKTQEAIVVETIQPQTTNLPTGQAGYKPQTTNGSSNRFYSPLVLNIAASEGVSMAELETIPGTGNEGRVTKKDILQYVSNRKSGAVNRESISRQRLADGDAEARTNEMVIPVSRVEQSQQSSGSYQTPTTYTGNVEIIEMDRMRKLIAEHMVRSKQTSPHVTSFTEADVTNMVMWRNKVKKDFEKREGTKITFTPLFIEAIVRCIKKFPLINCSLDGTNIVIKKDINIGMATALQSGNLIVPVIKNADQLNLVGLAKQVNNLADNARNGKLKADDTQGGTFTMTNVGSFGSLMGTPIINQPQVAILAVGAIKKRPVVIETPHGDSIAIRHMMYLSMSYDHRIVDGSLGATFLTAVAKELENFNIEREF
jgi:2-oxoglutarate dehydrogenase E2 component (dihydrolipoamide succinyltransferase)